jgi:hypothetical protein
MPNPVLDCDPPRNVEYLREALPISPVSTRLTKAIPNVFPLVLKAPDVVGKRSDCVEPVT